jgi:hypothetical protein
MSSPPPLPVLMDELIEEVLLRLPPEEPAWLARASAVCKPWRRILAAPRFPCRYREFHGTPPVLGFFHFKEFVPTSALLPAKPHRPGWIALDCRHGRALFATTSTMYRYDELPSDFTVLDPLMGHLHRVPFPLGDELWFSAAMLCATQGCDHHGCEQGHFFVVFISTSLYGVISARVYSSGTGAWSELIFLPEHYRMYYGYTHLRSVLVGDAIYFNSKDIVKYQFGTHHLSVFEKPANDHGILMTAEDGGLGFAALVDTANLAMWSRETGPEGTVGWAKLRVIDLKRLLHDGAFFLPPLLDNMTTTSLSGVAEGTQVIFVSSTYAGCYMVDLKSGRARKVSCVNYQNIVPYMRFYIPGITRIAYISLYNL